ncbi:MAG: glycosyl hydrolase, partial [Planctomycetia bacterium]|nr:glycosyl hydrolase [Planctomycetia bacterium]
THFYNVSWEGSHPNWTRGFETFFRERRGYDLRKYFPVLRGMVVGSVEESNRFLTDFHRTISDAFLEHCYRQIGGLCHERGMRWHSESGGPWDRGAPMFREADMFTFHGVNDMPQGEFWVGDTPDVCRSNARFTAMAAHIYGRPLCALESFTHMRYHWSMVPSHLKPSADKNYIDGANLLVWHTYTASPPEIGRPGYEYFAGTHLNRNTTWWDQSDGILAYLGRCQYLLQRGRSVSDLCVYTSDRNYGMWGRGVEWTPGSRLKPPVGYGYDLLNTEVLTQRLQVRRDEKSGRNRLVLPDGTSYAALVVDLRERSIPLSALRRVESLVREGACTILGDLRPESGRGLEDWPEGDAEIRNLSEVLWESAGVRGSAGVEESVGTGVGAENVLTVEASREIASVQVATSAGRKYGEGAIYTGCPVEEVLRSEGIPTDFQGAFEYTHREIPADADGRGGCEIYFVSGAGESECTFRSVSETPLFMDPVSGNTIPVKRYTVEGGRTRLPLRLPRYGSVFVVFPGDPVFPDVEPTGQVWDFQESPNLAGWETLELTGPWEVTFDPAGTDPQRESVSRSFETLTLWNDHGEDSIRYYSGTARYAQRFTVPSAPACMWLDPGEVHDIATVYVNGQRVGTLWTAPWRVEITRFVHPGENTVEVDVTNTWTNRLIGDAALPAEERQTRTNVQYYASDVPHQPHQGYAPTDPLRPSGLAGPVRFYWRPDRP